jgi:2-iminobutanoate/2-iminopropanoate deaminase
MRTPNLLACALALALTPACVVHVRDGEIQLDGRTHSIVSTVRAPLPVGPYSQAVVVDETLYAAGQVGLDPQTGLLVEGGVVAETRQALANQRAVLEAAGFSLRDVVLAQVYLADLGDYAAMNEVYSGFFPAPAPARTTVGVAALPKGARVEIQLVAMRRD